MKWIITQVNYYHQSVGEETILPNEYYLQSINSFSFISKVERDAGIGLSVWLSISAERISAISTIRGFLDLTQLWGEMNILKD